MQFSFQTVQFSPQFGADVALDDVLTAASLAGFRSVGLDMWSVDQHLERGHSLAGLSSTLERAELRCTDVLPLVVGADTDLTVESAARLATLATATGATWCATALGPEITDPRDRRARDGLCRCAEILDGAGVRLAIEFLPYSCVASIADAVELCDAVGWDAAGLLVDSWHTLVTGQLAGLAGLSAGDIALVQYSDGVIPRSDDVRDASRNHRRLPGQGDFDLAAFVEAVVATGYTGVVTPEVLSAEVRAAPPALFAAAVHRALQEHWERSLTPSAVHGHSPTAWSVRGHPGPSAAPTGHARRHGAGRQPSTIVKDEPQDG